MRPDDPDFWNNHALAALNNGHWEVSEKSYRRALELRPGDPALLNDLGSDSPTAQEYRFNSKSDLYLVDPSQGGLGLGGAGGAGASSSSSQFVEGAGGQVQAPQQQGQLHNSYTDMLLDFRTDLLNERNRDLAGKLFSFYF